MSAFGLHALLLVLAVTVCHAQPATLIQQQSRQAEIQPYLTLCGTFICRQLPVCLEACHMQTLSKLFVLATETKLPPNADYAALASTYFSPDAVVVVLPITALAGGLSALEYFVTFTRNEPVNVPPAIVNLAGSDFHDFSIVGNTATVVFDLIVANPTNAAKTFRLRATMLAQLNAASKVTAVTITYPLWEEGMKTLGMDTLLIDPTYKAKLLDAICTTHNTLCGNYKQFANKAACMAFMQGQPAPPVHRLAGNNFWCRSFHARYIDVSPEEHCPHIGPNSMQCSEDLPYSQAKVDALLKRPTFYGASFLLQGFINSTVGW